MAEMSIVAELQKGALDEKVPVVALLRKALVVAHQLQLKDFTQWIERELNGYESGEDMPAYRKVRGIPHAYNPYRGWEHIQFQSPEQAERFG